ncbi:MAG: cohesin domain-containing protein [Candidatus Marinimicrobia bacterium]|nr:cohesin domain-containing protein [Candidatus Neomarinimicrobiota bacterium]
MVWRKVATDLNTDYIYSDWPIPVNLAYDDADLLEGGLGGFPVGDLNWFPTQKAAWEDQKDNEYALIESRLENLSTIQIEVPNISSLPGDTLLIPINVQFPVGHTFSSAEFTINGYIDKLEFIDLVGINNSTPSMIGVSGWSYEINETDEALYIALYGSEEIFGDGVLFWIKYAVPDIATKGFIPIIIEKAVFNTGEIPVNISSGRVYITASFGDVDLNGKIQAYDASLILKYLVDYIDLSIPQLINAEVSGNGFVTAYDASLIAQYVVKLINWFPVETNPLAESASGNISMENKVVKPGDLIEVPLVLSNGNNILSFEGSITYNPQYLTFDSLNWSELVDGFSIEINANPGEIKFAGAGSVSDGGEGIFSTIKFKASENFVETVVALKKLRWNENDMLIDVDSTILSKFVDINEDQHNVPKEYALDQNYPNPFNPTTTISYQLPKSSFVKLYVYDVNGRLVETLVNEQKNAGYYSIIWNAKNVSSGVYLYRIDAGDFSSIKKCIFIK